MINLFTGLPGNGKTLYTVSYVKQWAEKDNRPVYYSGISDLTLPWTPIDPEKWFEAPANSIVVIDECQRVFRPRTVGKDVPEHVRQLETHRHLGIDIVLITQHPLLADSAIRRLVGKHMHIVRAFGTERATIHEWASVKDTCDKSAGRKDSIKHHWKFPKEAYGWYKSAEVHTVKRNIPMKFWVFCAIPFILAAMVGYMYYFTKKKTSGADVMTSGAVSESAGSTVGGASQGGAKKLSYKDAKEDAKQYAYENQPRIAGLPQTAPKYDELTTPTVAPAPAACMATKHRCACYTQQATPIHMAEELCRDIVANGYFQDFDIAGKKDKQQPIAMTGQTVAMNDVNQQYSRVPMPVAPQPSYAPDGEPVQPRPRVSSFPPAPPVRQPQPPRTL